MSAFAQNCPIGDCESCAVCNCFMRWDGPPHKGVCEDGFGTACRDVEFGSEDFLDDMNCTFCAGGLGNRCDS